MVVPQYFKVHFLWGPAPSIDFQSPIRGIIGFKGRFTLFLYDVHYYIRPLVKSIFGKYWLKNCHFENLGS